MTEKNLLSKGWNKFNKWLDESDDRKIERMKKQKTRLESEAELTRAKAALEQEKANLEKARTSIAQSKSQRRTQHPSMLDRLSQNQDREGYDPLGLKSSFLVEEPRKKKEEAHFRW